jgi:hypothetical protein
MIDIRQRIHLVIREDGSITAKTENTYGEDCLPRIDLLEDMLEALTFDSTFTDDYSKKISNVDVVSGINLETSA